MNKDYMRYADAYALKLIKDGALIEAGFSVIEKRLKEEGKGVKVRNEAKAMFFAGAQHIFATIVRVLEPGAEATDNDVRVMEQISVELEAHEAMIKARFGVNYSSEADKQ